MIMRLLLLLYTNFLLVMNWQLFPQSPYSSANFFLFYNQKSLKGQSFLTREGITENSQKVLLTLQKTFIKQVSIVERKKIFFIAKESHFTREELKVV